MTLIPFFQNSSDIIFLFYILARVSGFFLISPIFSNQNVPAMVRIGLIFFSTAILAMALYPTYRGPSPEIYLPELQSAGDHLWAKLAATTIKELSIGFVMGFAFHLIFETILIAGQILSNLAGFAASQLVDPVTNIQTGIVSQVFNITFVLIFLSLDLHLDTVKLLTESFYTLPLGNYHLPYELVNEINHGTGRMFFYAMRIAIVPFMILSLVTVSLGLMARVMPEMNIFLIGFPLKILISFYSLITTVKFFPIIINPLFKEFYTFAKLIIYRISTG